MWTNHLTKQQERNFKRRCRFTACGEPVDVFKEADGNFMLVTINRYYDGSAAWLEADGEEIRPDYLRACKKAPESIARSVIAQELESWARLPEGTIAGYDADSIRAERERIAALHYFSMED